jgi:hypothetical protein
MGPLLESFTVTRALASASGQWQPPRETGQVHTAQTRARTSTHLDLIQDLPHLHPLFFSISRDPAVFI